MKAEEVLKDPCPTCGKTGYIHLIHRKEPVKVRGEEFVVDAEYFVCDACKTEFETGDSVDSLPLAYHAYRAKHSYVQPEAIVQWRKEAGIKQADLAALLGWSVATLSRFENGALLDATHDNALRSVMTVEGLKAMLDGQPAVSAEGLQRLHAALDAKSGDPQRLMDVVQSVFARAYASEVYWPKVIESVLFLSQSKEGVSRTKLNKLMFYADFLHAKHFAKKVTGLPYFRFQHGPVPASYELLFSTLQEMRLIAITEQEIGENIAYMHRAVRSADTRVFSETEMKVLAYVQAQFLKTSATEISELSHKEDAWTKTLPGKEVSITFAKALSLSL